MGYNKSCETRRQKDKIISYTEENEENDYLANAMADRMDVERKKTDNNSGL